MVPPKFTYSSDGWLLQIKWKSLLIPSCVKLVGSYLKSLVLEHVHNRKIARWLYICMINSKCANGSVILYTNIEFRVIHHRLRIILRPSFLSHAVIRNLPVNKRLRNFGRIQFEKSSPVCTKISLHHKLTTVQRIRC